MTIGAVKKLANAIYSLSEYMKERQPFTRHLSPEYLLLGMLKISPSHGYDLHQQIERDLRYVWRLSLSQVYSVLNRLEKRGMITGKIMQQDERPDRKRFQLTPAGERQFKQWLETPVGASVHAVRIAFLSKLYLAQRLPDVEIKPLFLRQQEALQKGLTGLEQTHAELDPSRNISGQALRLRISQLQSLLRWLAEYEHVWIKG